MMTIQKLAKSGWAAFFNQFAAEALGLPATIEILAPGIGAQIAAEAVPVIGVSYDHKDDIIEISLEGLEHIIHRPASVFVDNAAADAIKIEIIDADGTKHIVQLVSQKLLPA